MNATGPIGIFDSGVGGLSVLLDIQRALPNEHVIYVADSAYVPYGSKSQEFIQQRSLKLSQFLIAQGAKAIVIACNTATAAAAALLRATFTLPIVAMEPAVKPAAAATQNGVVGVLATVGMLQSAQYAALLDRFGHGIEVVTQPCPGLADQVEAGDLDGPATRALLEQYLAPLLLRGADTIVLGCTHYPFLRAQIADLVGPDIKLIDTGAAVARRLQSVLTERNLLTTHTTKQADTFWTSDDPAHSAEVISRLLGHKVCVTRLPDQMA